MRGWAWPCCVELDVASLFIGLKHITMLDVYNKGRIVNNSDAGSVFDTSPWLLLL